MFFLIDIFLLRGFLLPGEVPGLLARVGEFVPPAGSEGVILSGRLPVWAFAALTAFYASTRPWVGVFDPRMGGGVVVESRDPARPVGTLIPLDGDEITVEVEV